MVSFDWNVRKGHKRLNYNRDLGVVDVGDDKVTLVHKEFTVEIPYGDIDAIDKKKAIIKVNLRSGEFYELLPPVFVNTGFGAMQQIRQDVRKAEMIYKLLTEKWRASCSI